MQGVWDGEAESRLIADEIETQRRAGRKYSDIAILVRASFQMRAFEERFVLLAIPYTVVGGPRFFERAEIRDAHAYLRLIQSEDDDLAFERIVNTPKRGIGDTSVQKILAIARQHNLSALTAVRGLINTDELQARTRTALSNFVRDLDRWRAMAGTVTHGELTETILEESGYTDMQRADRASGQTRLDNLKELTQSMQAFDSLQAYLEHVSLVMDLDRGAGEDAVQIMTLHAAKGWSSRWSFCPAGRKGCSRPSAASTRRARRVWRRNGASPTWASPGPARTRASASPPTVWSMAAGPASCPAASWTNCPSTMCRPRATPAITAPGRV